MAQHDDERSDVLQVDTRLRLVLKLLVGLLLMFEFLCLLLLGLPAVDHVESGLGARVVDPVFVNLELVRQVAPLAAAFQLDRSADNLDDSVVRYLDLLHNLVSRLVKRDPNAARFALVDAARLEHEGLGVPRDDCSAAS